MKKYVNLISIILLSLSTVACKKNASISTTNPSSDVSGATTDTQSSTQQVNIIERWRTKLFQDIRLDGKIKLSFIPTSGGYYPLVQEIDFTSILSYNKCYIKQGDDIKCVSYYNDDLKLETDPDDLFTGAAVCQVIQPNNTLLNLPLVDSNNQYVHFDDYYENKLPAFREDYTQIDDKTFTLTNKSLISDVVSSITQINLPFSSCDFYDERTSKLQLKATGSTIIDQQYNGKIVPCNCTYMLENTYFNFDVDQAFETLEIKEETLESKKLKQAFDEMQSLQSYGFNETYDGAVVDNYGSIQYKTISDDCIYINNSNTKSIINTTQKSGWAKFSNDEYYNFNIEKDSNNKDVFILTEKNDDPKSFLLSSFYDVRYDLVNTELYSVNDDGTYTLDNPLLRDSSYNDMCKLGLTYLIVQPERKRLFRYNETKNFKIKLKDDQNGKSHLDTISFIADDRLYTYKYNLEPVDVSKYSFNIDEYDLELNQLLFNTWLIESKNIRSSFPFSTTGLKIEIETSFTSKAIVKINDELVTSDIHYIADVLSFSYDSMNFEIKSMTRRYIDVILTSGNNKYQYTIYTKEVIDIRKNAVSQIEEFDSLNKAKLDALSDDDKKQVASLKKKALSNIEKCINQAQADNEVNTYKTEVNKIINK